MTQEFVPPEQALELKHIGFDEPCFGMYNRDKKLFIISPTNQNSFEYLEYLCTPTFSQAFKFFRELPDWPIESWIRPIISEQPRHYRVFIWTKGEIVMSDAFDTHPEAEIGCLNRLIEIVKNRQL